MSMFSGCTQLAYVKAMFLNYTPTNDDYSDPLSGFINTVPPNNNGIYVMNVNATYNPNEVFRYSGAQGYLSWTIQTASS
jgi:hypothetical protein